MKNVMDVLEERGFIKQTVYGDDLRKKLETESVTFYVGFDPTADSLHIGHYIPIMAMAWMQKYGHRPIALFGGGTGMIGDPSGRSDMRQMMTRETINHNIECFKKQMSRFINFEGENGAIIANNADWLLDLNYVNFLRDIGVYFSVNKMLTAECFKQRMEKGLTFFEFNYMLMQGYDFLHLNREYGCSLEVGGDDQWSNMLGGTELIRRKLGKDAYAMTITLLLNSEGKKMGKTASGAVWLDPNKTSPFDFYQYWRNVGDADVLKCIRMLTFLPIEQIEEMANWEGAKLNEAKDILAYELTTLVHGEEEANKAREASRALFSGAGSLDNMPTAELTEADFIDGTITIVNILSKAKLVPSNSEGRRAVEPGGVTVNGEKIDDVKKTYTASDINAGDFVVKRGKKSFAKIVVK